VRREGKNFGQRICNNKVRCNWEHLEETHWELREHHGKVIGNLENIFENALGT
jgi:hypothetical protein